MGAAASAGSELYLFSQTEDIIECSFGSLFGDNPSGWAFGRMERFHHEKREPEQAADTI